MERKVLININEGKFVRVSTATASGRVVLDDDGRHGRFTDLHATDSELSDMLDCLEKAGIIIGEKCNCTHSSPLQSIFGGLPFLF